MTGKAERLEVPEVMQTAERAMRPLGLDDVIDLEPVGLALFSIARIPSPERLMPAPRAAIFVAPLCSAPRKGPPMVFPKRVGALVAAPGTPALREFRSAPSARAFDARRERTDSY
jgi:hypothetical protein